MRAEHASGASICVVEMIVFCSSSQLLMRAEHASGALICAVEMIVFCSSWQLLMRAGDASGALVSAVEWSESLGDSSKLTHRSPRLECPVFPAPEAC